MQNRTELTTLDRRGANSQNLEGTRAMEYWAVWYPRAAATGLLLGRGMLDETENLLLHAAPEVITVEVTDVEGHRLAYGKDLKRTQDTPMCHLRRDGSGVVREDFWPGPEDNGLPVMLAGGEVGKLAGWWHSDDRKEWRWRVEFYNSMRSPDRSTMAG